MAQMRSGFAVQSKIQMLIYGEQFTGKSTLASQLCYFKREDGKPFRVLMLDNEMGSIDDLCETLAENGVQSDNLKIITTQSLDEVLYYIGKVKRCEDIYELDDDGNETETVTLDADGEPFRADAIIIDGSTILNLTTKQALIEFSKKRNGVKAAKAGLIGDERIVKVDGAGLEYKDYQTINFKGQNLILELASSGVHWVVTARETDEKETVKDRNGEPVSISTGRKIPEGFKGMLYNVKTVVRTYRDPKTDIVYAQVEKDRTNCHKFGEVLEDPTLLDWQKIIEGNKNRAAYNIKNGLQQSVEIERKSYEKELSSFIDGDSKSGATSGNTKKTDELAELKDNIINKMRGFSPPEKSSATKSLKEKGLPATPTAVKAESDISVLKKILSVITK